MDPESLKATGRVLAKIRAFDPTFPTGNDAMILAWTEVLAPWALPDDDLLGAVTDWFRSHHDSPRVADILRLARDRRNARTERMRPEDRPVIDKSAPDPEPAEIEVARAARAELDHAVARIASQRSLDRAINALPTQTCLHCSETLTRTPGGLYVHADGKERCPAMPPAAPLPPETSQPPGV